MAFSELTQPIPFTLNAGGAGDTIGTLTVTLQPSVATGAVAALTLDPPGATLSNQSASVRETVSAGNLTLVNGSVTVSALAGPTSLVATAVSTSQINVSWSGVGGADHYEIWRSSNGSAFAVAGTSPTTAFSDTPVSAGTTYLYRALAVDGVGGTSALSNVDAATTIFFTDDPLVVGSTLIKAVHITELRSAVDAMRAAASLPPLSADPSIAVGLPMLASHINALRTGLDAARTAIGLVALSYTDASLTPGGIVKAAHVQELRNGTK
jgi:hypothetical protein